ncbi:HAD-superfamily hydrolase [Terfezia boudieri ATCC MYA-4762]|uniref:HAD-superfamily hydrolase n=1 Tax=Terfezia boudieri ATCC MYA-4762 TaxID=1051890 RepID=A0A3N4LDA2_9PEZI|nr:HAD-superfamily hydrolase [Terfezia boudieri ATCC MYA-4762]
MMTATVLHCKTAVLQILRRGIQPAIHSARSVPLTSRDALTPHFFQRALACHSLRSQFHTGPPRALSKTTTTDLPSSTAAEQLPPLPSPPSSWSGTSPFAFAFDIDGVLCHSKTPYPSAKPTLHQLQCSSVPFLFLTNSGGETEQARATTLSERFGLTINDTNIVQSHTPFQRIASEGKLPPAYDPYVPGGRKFANSVLVVGGPTDGSCRLAAQQYGFKNVVLVEDFLVKYSAAVGNNPSTLWPYRSVSKNIRKFAKPLPCLRSGEVMPIDAIFIFNDPRDWGLSIQLLLDIMIPALEGNTAEKPPPPLIFSNPDLLYATSHPAPRLGQGAFRAALEGTYRRVVEATRPELDPQMKYACIGKPFQETYEYAEDLLVKLAKLAKKEPVGAEDQLKRVYMIGDNPLSDIQGANMFKSPRGVEWVSVLVETGVYKPGQSFPPGGEPKIVVKDVWSAVQWALEKEGWQK